jgi:hypothetical protein
MKEMKPQITPQPTPLHGQGQISAHFSASLEFTRLEIRSSEISEKIGTPSDGNFILVQTLACCPFLHSNGESVKHCIVGYIFMPWIKLSYLGNQSSVQNNRL